MLCVAAFAFAQHDMKNMPGMQMDKSKSTPVKKQALNQNQNPQKNQLLKRI